MKHKQRSQSGFTLLEVLIALLILAVGLLGLAALHTVGLRSNHSAYQRTQATILTYDMMDRLRSNRNRAMSGNYNLLLAATPAGGDGAAPLEDDDLSEWITNLGALLPNGDGEVACDANGFCTIFVEWQDGRAEGGPTMQRFTITSQI
jgi:type IV pilus assembly protein PilV